MEDRLTGRFTGVNHQTVAAFGTNLLAGNAPCGEDQTPHIRRVGFIQFVQRCEVPARYDQQMQGGEGMNIADDKKFLVFIDDFGGGGLLDDPAKDAIFHIRFWLQYSCLKF